MSRLNDALAQVRHELDVDARQKDAMLEAAKASHRLLDEATSEIAKLAPGARSHIEVSRDTDSLTITRGGSRVLTLRAGTMGLGVFYPGEDVSKSATETLGEQTVFRVIAKAIEVSRTKMPTKADLGGTIRLWD